MISINISDCNKNIEIEYLDAKSCMQNWLTVFRYILIVLGYPEKNVYEVIPDDNS